MGLLVYLCLVLLAVVCCLVREWLCEQESGRAYPLLDVEDAERQAMSEIAARTRRAEEQMRRVAYRGRT